MFHEILEHRWFLSESAGKEVELEEAARDYVVKELAQRPDTRAILPAGPPTAEPTGQSQS